MSDRPHCLNRDECSAKGAGHCRVCWGKHAHTITRDSPVRKEAVRASLRERNKTKTPAQRAKLAEVAKRHAVLARPEVVAKRDAPEARLKAALSRIGSWLPPDRYDEYLYLTNNKRLSKVEARRVIEESIPGTIAHARLNIANIHVAQRIRAERDRAQAY